MKLLLAGLLGLSLSCQAATWERYATTDKAIFWYDASTSTYPSHTIADVWTKIDFDSAEKDMLRAMVRNQINCQTKIAATLFMAVELRSGEIKHLDAFPPLPIPEGSPMDSLRKTLCEGRE